jgi:GT2 family glycosyltransferase
MDISIVIVNYNVREYVVNLLHSIERALGDLKVEIIVVDNASSDGSVEFLQDEFGGKIKLLAQTENLGFGRANNLAIAMASGKYTLLINPDTLMREDTLQVMHAFMEKNPQVAMAGCKFLNPDGSFAIDSRHSIPNISSALWRVLGLSYLFPKSRVFGDYNLTWMDPQVAAPVPAVSGAFMFCRSDALRQVGGFDDRYFMYVEDIDLCYRLSQAGFGIHYLPTTSIVHFKGESTRRNSFDHVLTHSRSLLAFFDKYYSHLFSGIFRLFIMFGIIIRGGFIFTQNLLRRAMIPLIDTAIINGIILVAFTLRYTMKAGLENFAYQSGFLAIHLLITFFYILYAYINNLFTRKHLDLGAMFRALSLTFLSVAGTTFFLPELAFSRLVIAAGYGLSIIFLISWRLAAARGRQSKLGRFFRPRLLLVGSGRQEAAQADRIRMLVRPDQEVLGLVSSHISSDKSLAGIPIVGNLTQLNAIIKRTRPEQIVFLSGEVSYDEIIATMENIAKLGLQIRFVPEKLDVVIGKEHVESLNELPLTDFGLAFWRPANRLGKRILDLSLALLLSIPAVLALLIYWPFKKGHLERRKVRYSGGYVWHWLLLHEAPFLVNLGLALPGILQGHLSFVGAAYLGAKNTYSHPLGLTGPVQLNKHKTDNQIRHDIEQHYLLSYSLLTDFRILQRWLKAGLYVP